MNLACQLLAKGQPRGETCMFRPGDFALGPLLWGIRTLCVKLRGLGDPAFVGFPTTPAGPCPTPTYVWCVYRCRCLCMRAHTAMHTDHGNVVS